MFNTYKHFDCIVDLHRSLTSEQMNCYLARLKAYASKFSWSTQLEPIFHNCLVHTSPHVPGRVAYFASIENMMRNVTTRTSPEMFLTRFLSTAPGDLQAAWKVEVLGHILPTLKFVENNDADEWLRVYNNGPPSCVAHTNRARGYAHPKNNLALAYVEENDKVLYRAIVNRAKSTYLRIYGWDRDSDNAFMSTALNKAGFSKDPDTLKGELIKVYYEDCSHCGRTAAVGPYFDGSCSNVTFTPGNQHEATISKEGRYLEYEEDVSVECDCNGEDKDDYYDPD